MVNGKFDPNAGLASSGIAGTAPEEEENKNANTDEEMKDVSKKDGGKWCVWMMAFRIDTLILYHCMDFPYLLALCWSLLFFSFLFISYWICWFLHYSYDLAYPFAKMLMLMCVDKEKDGGDKDSENKITDPDSDKEKSSDKEKEKEVEPEKEKEPEKPAEENKSNDSTSTNNSAAQNESNKMDTSEKPSDAKLNDSVTENGTAVNGNDKDSEDNRKLFNEADLQRAASAALASAAVKAKHMSALEERKIKSLVALLVETQMKKLVSENIEIQVTSSVVFL